MRKRQRFVVTTLVLILGMALFQSLNFEWKYIGVIVISIVGVVLFAWSLKEGMSGAEWLTLLLLPLLFVAGFALFTMLIPDGWLVRLAIYLVFGLATYSMLLTENIYSVAAIRTIALLRAAHAIGFLLTVLTAFLCFYTIVTFRLDWWLIGLLVFGVGWGLLVPGIWSVKLEPLLSRGVVKYAFCLAICMAVLAMAVTVWPVGTVVNGLFLATMMYIFLGLVQHQFLGRLFGRTVVEYLTVGSVVLVTMLLTSGLS